MALTRFALELLAPHLRGARVLCLGYPDLLVTPTEAVEVFRFGNGRPLGVTPYAVAVKGLPGPFVSTADVFARAGVAALRCVDLAPSRGIEETVDLNDAVDLGEHDLVIDAGTLEHCANVGQALLNAARAVAVGGRVFHSPPLTMLNHGFYNICPTLLHDFYAQNGWHVEHLSGFLTGALSPKFPGIEVERTARFRVSEEAALYFLARRRDTGGDPLRWPKQSKYS